MTLSIIILNYNMKGLLKQCLRGIERTSLDHPYEIIVVDNASTDGTTVMMAEYLDTRREGMAPLTYLPLEENRGYAAGNNRGIACAQGRYVLILNPDIAVLKDSIEVLVAFLERHPNVGVVGPKLLYPNKALQYSCSAFPNLWTPLVRRTSVGRLPWSQDEIRRYLMLDWDHNSTKPVDWLMGSALMIRASALPTVGLLDERFFMYFEDTDWCRRFWSHGFPVYYNPESVMVHYHQRLSAQSGHWGFPSWGARTHITSALKYFWKHRHTRPWTIPPAAQEYSYVIPTEAGIQTITER